MREGLYYDKTFEVLETASKTLGLSDETLRHGKDIATQVRLDIQGRESKAIAAGILYLLRKQGEFYAQVNDIAYATNTNPATVIILSALLHD